MNKLNRIYASGILLSCLLLLSGCVQMKNGQPTGVVWDFLGKPMSMAIEYFANNQGLGYGVGLIIVVIIVRLIIFPLGIYQSKNATYHSEKRNFLSPIFTPINERMKNAETQEEKILAQQELLNAQRAHGVSIMGGIGCLPILIQMPFFSAIYVAAANTPGIKASVFLGIDLGKPSLVLTAIVALLYFIQSKMSMYGMDQEQQDQMKNMMYMTPIMMVMFTLGAQAGVTLYWVVGGLFQILQQLVINYWVRPKMKARVAAEFEANPPQWDKYKPKATKDVTPKNAGALKQGKQNKKKRNAGKQKSR
ncbi:membrane protein insertase YidC [Streptococcus oricebi]|uniref:Membrane protein insertase YidC n=1 Tax=Streptococcus oricebi TaxID=1547447 RepID=A0ABS5B4M2_9STRE|nr:membrane protein insertase YidC [Streptococcus oricebi]